MTFTATIAPVSPGAGTPTGTVNFLDNGTQIGTGTLNSSGVATFSTTTLSVATHSITAVYVGDTNFKTSTSTAVSQVVSQASTTSTVATSSATTLFGQGLTFTATIVPVSPGAGTPTGTVTFKEGAATLGTGTLDSTGKATFTTSSLPRGSHSITVVYPGDTNFTTSTSAAITQVVNQASTTTARCFRRQPDVSGQSVTFTATVAAVTPGAGTPTGTVNFLDNGTQIGSNTLTSARGDIQHRRCRWLHIRSPRCTSATRTSRPAARMSCPRS